MPDAKNVMAVNPGWPKHAPLKIYTTHTDCINGTPDVETQRIDGLGLSLRHEVLKQGHGSHWYAWRPVTLTSGRRAWLEKVWRMQMWTPERSWIEYREINK